MVGVRLDHKTRQRQIVEAARELIAAGGVDRLTTRALAEKVGVSEAAVYRHVRSKEEVLLLLVDEIRDSLFRAISRATSSDTTAHEKLEHLLRLHLSYVELRRGISFVVITEAMQFQEPKVRAAGRKLIEDYLQLVEGIVSEGIARGEIAESVNPAVAATMFFGMIQTTVTRWLYDAIAHPLTENTAELWRSFKSVVELGATQAQAKSVA